MGILGEALSSAMAGGSQAMLDSLTNQIANERQMALDEFRAKLHETSEINREDRIEKRANTAGTKENLERENLKSTNEINKLKIAEAQDEVAKKKVMNGQDAQFSDGSFRVTGDDGIIRRLRKDGSPIDGVGSDGVLKGQTKKDYEEAGLSLKEKTEIDYRNKSLSLQEKQLGISAGNAARQNKLADLQLSEHERKVKDADAERGLKRGVLESQQAGAPDAEKIYKRELDILRANSGSLDMKGKHEVAMLYRDEANSYDRQAKEAIDPEEKKEFAQKASAARSRAKGMFGDNSDSTVSTKTLSYAQLQQFASAKKMTVEAAKKLAKENGYSVE